MAKPPAFQFYARDWLAEDSSGLTYEEKGVHVDLLCFAWLEGGIPADPDRIARLLRMSKREFGRVWQEVGGRWEPGPDDCLINRRQEDYRVELASYKATKSAAGKAGAEARWGQK